MTTMTYKYTRPRLPIAAMNRGPGPCYALPSLFGHAQHDPRSNHSRSPAYQFGTYHLSSSTSCGPGPCHYPNAKVYRNGRDDGLQHSLHARLPELPKLNVPAPGTYDAVTLSQTSPRPPAYSFGVVCPPIAGDMTPGPNVYSIGRPIGKEIESTKNQPPAYSLYGRNKVGAFYEDFRKTPGPGTYALVETSKYKSRQPQFSIIGRNMMPEDSSVKPGPGAHSPETVTLHKNMSPRYSFGMRHSEYEAPITERSLD